VQLYHIITADRMCLCIYQEIRVRDIDIAENTRRTQCYNVYYYDGATRYIILCSGSKKFK